MQTDLTIPGEEREAFASALDVVCDIARGSLFLLTDREERLQVEGAIVYVRSYRRELAGPPLAAERHNGLHQRPPGVLERGREPGEAGGGEEHAGGEAAREFGGGAAPRDGAVGGPGGVHPTRLRGGDTMSLPARAAGDERNVLPSTAAASGARHA